VGLKFDKKIYGFSQIADAMRLKPKGKSFSKFGSSLCLLSAFCPLAKASGN
jgi:hypothetical protein